MSPRPEAVCPMDAHVAFRKGTGFHELSDQAASRECRLVDVDKFIEVEHHMAKIGQRARLGRGRPICGFAVEFALLIEKRQAAYQFFAGWWT